MVLVSLLKWCIEPSTESHRIDEKKAEDAIPQEVTEEGLQVMEEFLRAWSAQQDSTDGEDVIMADEEDPEANLEKLKKCMEQFRPRIENNRWLQSVLSSL